jgi:hypothetical protein
LRHAVAVRSPAATIVHSDRGSQFIHASSFIRCRTTDYAVRWAAACDRGLDRDHLPPPTAEVELALVGAVLGDVGQPDLVGGLGAELAVDEVVVDRGSGFLLSPRFLAKIDQIRRSCTVRSVIKSRPILAIWPGSCLGELSRSMLLVPSRKRLGICFGRARIAAGV